MCTCVCDEVLRQCSAANPVIYACRPYAQCYDCTELNCERSEPVTRVGWRISLEYIYLDPWAVHLVLPI